MSLERDPGFSLVEVAFAVRLPDGRRAGTVVYRNLSRRRRSAEIGIELYPDYRGSGLGPRAIRALLGHLFDTMGLRRVWLRVLPDNERALRCYEKCGFRPAGHGRAYLFVPCLIMQLTDEEFRRQSPAPEAALQTGPGPAPGVACAGPGPAPGVACAGPGPAPGVACAGPGPTPGSARGGPRAADARAETGRGTKSGAGQ